MWLLKLTLTMHSHEEVDVNLRHSRRVIVEFEAARVARLSNLKQRQTF